MQFVLVTDNGFRFALAHFAITTMPVVTLGEKVWEGIEWILRAGFKPYWLLCHGGEPNQSFIKMCFEDPEEKILLRIISRMASRLLLWQTVRCVKQRLHLRYFGRFGFFCRRSSMEKRCFKTKQQKGMGKITDSFEILLPEAIHFHEGKT